MHILDLDDDSLIIILSYILDTPLRSSKKHGLVCLSSICTRFRSVILPFLFRSVRWPHFQPSAEALGWGQPETIAYPVVPKTILSNIRRFTLSCAFQFPTDRLVTMIGDMASLSSFIFLDCNHPPSETVLDALAQVPSLSSIDFCRTPLNLNTTPPSFSFTALENLSIKCAWKLVSVSGGAPQDPATFKLRFHDPPDMTDKIINSLNRRSAELAFSTQFIQSNLAFLERVEIEGALFPFNILRSSTWPRLHTLIFYGRPPMSQSVPIITLFGGMPKLEDLQFRWSMRLVEEPQRDKFHFLPDSLIPKPKPGSTPQTLNLTPLLPSLRSLTLSNVVPQDRIFQYLPTSLERLHLPTILEDGCGGAGMRLVNIQDIGVGLGPAAASSIMCDMKQSGARPVELRLTLSEMPSPTLIQEIADTLPGIQVLELGQAWYDAFPSETIFPESAYLTSLTPLTSLQELKLSLPFPSTSRNRRSTHFGPLSEELELAHAIAKVLPKLERVGFQCTFSYPESVQKRVWDDWNEWAGYRVWRWSGGGVGVEWEERKGWGS
ncbi:hypothetical protein JAAARDRAFT_193373 [Jaapia argillacea MUCL 33604]|uniref:F-box domain-containing protein n=1 Tax=Jaapia argillacea MUCL 33604 TaxID=933084 RepID=A0A067PSU3_9AGAM|nr:hypothetical protein JAAARDRAFT_193373 [Jaapia argillacea MUCL 33604]